MPTKRQESLPDFARTHPVFTLDEIANVLASDSTRSMMHRLRRHVEAGRLEQLARGLYAVVPPNQSPETFQPDPFLAARATRPDAVFCYHSALELLGVAHSAWNQCSVFTASRRPSLKLRGSEVLFLDHPAALRKVGDVELGTRKVERRGFLLRVTSPERTLVEGFRRPDLTGGLPELVESAGGFATLDLALLQRVLEQYDERKLWAAVGWFLERHQESFHVPDAYLQKLEAYRPRSPLYVPRGQRGGVLNPRWNVILPAEVVRGEPNEG
jgi:predicted transcriptional regulator of viral defense system